MGKNQEEEEEGEGRRDEKMTMREEKKRGGRGDRLTRGGRDGDNRCWRPREGQSMLESTRGTIDVREEGGDSRRGRRAVRRGCLLEYLNVNGESVTKEDLTKIPIL